MKVAEYKPITTYGIEEPPFMHYVVDVDKPKPVEKPVIQKKQLVKKVVATTSITVKPNDTPEIEPTIAPTNVTVFEVPIVTANNPVDSNLKLTKSMKTVEFAPIFPECESLGSNTEKADCMSSKINTFINKNFRKELLENLSKNETHRIYVNFKINASGYITDVVANSHNEKLKNEAQRVLKGLPAMKPGRQGDKNVEVLYTLPIVFKIQ